MLDRDAFSVATVGRMDMLVDKSDFSNEGYRFTSYRQYVLWQNGYLGRAIGEWYHRVPHVPHVPSGTSTPVLMGYILVLNSNNSKVLKCMYN